MTSANCAVGNVLLLTYAATTSAVIRSNSSSAIFGAAVSAMFRLGKVLKFSLSRIIDGRISCVNRNVSDSEVFSIAAGSHDLSRPDPQCTTFESKRLRRWFRRTKVELLGALFRMP